MGLPRLHHSHHKKHQADLISLSSARFNPIRLWTSPGAVEAIKHFRASFSLLQLSGKRPGWDSCQGARGAAVGSACPSSAPLTTRCRLPNHMLGAQAV